jgi:hypothetical protein
MRVVIVVLGLGPLAYAVLPATAYTPSVALAAGVALVCGVAACALVAIEASRTAALAGVMAAAALVLGATSVLLGALAGGLLGLFAWGGLELARLARRPRARDAWSQIEALQHESHFAAMDAFALSELSRRAKQHAVDEARAGRTSLAWAHADSAFALDRAHAHVRVCPGNYVGSSLRPLRSAGAAPAALQVLRDEHSCRLTTRRSAVIARQHQLAAAYFGRSRSFTREEEPA